MSLVPPGLPAAIGKTTNAAMPDLATITRTGATAFCRISADMREIHLENFPHFTGVKRWRVVFPQSADLRDGDTFTVTGKGTYVVLVALSPTSYSVDNTCYCMHTREVGGTIPFFTNTTATFSQTGTEQKLTASVDIRPISQEPQPGGFALEFKYAVTWDDALAFPAFGATPSRPVGQDDTIKWTDSAGLPHRAKLHRPARQATPLPLATAMVEDID